jgi:integrin beta 3
MSDPAKILADAIQGYIDPALDAVHERIDRMPAAREGRDGRDGARGEDGKDGLAGADGQDGLGFEDMSVEHDGERTVILRFARGELVREFPLTFPVPIYRDVYRPERAYVRGDVVTFGGSMWHCNAATEEKPGESGAWTLAAKRGRDGQKGKAA